MKYLKKVKIAYLIACVLFMLVGLLLCFFPKFSLVAICYIVGAVSVAFGIVKIFAYFSEDKYNIAFQFDLALGIFSIIIGLIILCHPKWIMSVFPVIIGILTLVESLFSFQTSIDAKRFGFAKWFVLLISSLLSAAFGIILIFNPFESSLVITAFYGVSIFLTGLEKMIITIYTTQKIKKEMKYNAPIEVDYTIKDE